MRRAQNTTFMLPDISGGRECFLNPALGQQSLAQSARTCNGCGACSRACPVYNIDKAEVNSPRGRNQLLHYLLARRVQNSISKKDLLRPAEGCIMCSQCTAACAARVPTAKHMLHLKTALGAKPGLFLELAARMPRLFFAIKTLRVKKPQSDKTQIFYMPNADGAKHMQASIALISKKHPDIKIIKSGLYLSRAALTAGAPVTKILDNILAEYGAAHAAHTPAIVVDNIEDFRLLKQSVEFGEKYRPLAQAAQFITEHLKPIKIKPRGHKNLSVLLQDNNSFSCDDKIPQLAKNLFVCPRGKFLLKLELGAQSAGRAPTPTLAKRLAAQVARARADLFIVFSSADEIYFNNILKTFYPHTRVMHIAQYFYEN